MSIQQPSFQRHHRSPIAFENEGQILFGMIHRPDDLHAGPCPAVLILHGLVGSKDQPHRLFLRLAESLRQNGLIVLRVDLRGRGDSEGDTIDMTPQRDLSDVQKALDFLYSQPDVNHDQMGVIGISWGGTLAALIAGQDKRIKHTVLINTLADMPRPWGEYQMIDGRQALDLWGHPVGREFYDSGQGLKPLESIKQANGPVLIVQSSADEAVDPSNAEGFRQALAEAEIAHELVMIPGADHALLRYDWSTQAINLIADWFKRTLSQEG